METSFGFFDLIETFPKPGCAVCNLLLSDAHRLLDSLLYEYVMDPKIQNDFRDSRGLCDEHGWHFTKLGNALGVAVLYERALEDLVSILEQSTPARRNASGRIGRLFAQNANEALVARLEPAKPCIACKTQNANEARYIGLLSDHITDARMQSAYRDSEGLCLPHFRQALRHTADGERSTLLINLQTEIWTRLREELVEFMRKSDYQHVDEKMGAEGSSWHRVVARLGGEHGVFGLRRTNGK